MYFEEALAEVRRGERAQRRGWNGKGLHIAMEVPDGAGKIKMPYIYLQYPESHPDFGGTHIPWAPSQTDMIADDWTTG